VASVVGVAGVVVGDSEGAEGVTAECSGVHDEVGDDTPPSEE
jgi:hypothetical protein